MIGFGNEPTLDLNAPSSNDPDVVVVGGGIGGLSTAYALARSGLQVRVLERAEEFGEVGAGIQLAPNCTRILSDYGLLEKAKILGVVPDRMVMRDGVDGTELTRLDLRHLEERYGFPYMVIHRSDLHRLFVDACVDAGVELLTGRFVEGYDTTSTSASVTVVGGEVHRATVVIAADGLKSVARKRFVDDEPISSSYVAYRGTVPIADLDRPVDLDEIVVHIGPRCHLVHYGLRGGEMLNQVAVFESPKAKAGVDDWGTPDELDDAFAQTTDGVRELIPNMWRDVWWRMFDRTPLTTWVDRRIALLGDSAHAPLQYMAQGAIMAIEDGWVLAQHAARHRDPSGTIDWDATLRDYEAVRPEHCRRVVTTAREWGDLWHLDGESRKQRNAILRARDTYDYSFIDWIYGPTALYPDQEPPMFKKVALADADMTALSPS
ncbi:3-hydroxybenzoate 6-hydroxylase [Alloalcanivorax gelatiniphagus]